MKNSVVLISLGLLALACSPPQPKEPVVMGFGLPLTGPLASWGQPARKGALLALEEINAAGGIHGRPLEIDFQDDQADPKQAIAVAQKFIANPRILLASELGTPSSMVVTPLYQKANLPFCGFFNFHPDFTQPGDYIWSHVPSVQAGASHHAHYVHQLGLRRVAFLAINNDIGKVYGSLVKDLLLKKGIQIVIDAAYLPDEKDFRSVLSKIKIAGVDGFVIVSYVSDGALLSKQIRSQGFKQPIVGHSALNNQFIALAGDASEGIHISGLFYAQDTRPEVVNFIQKWKTKYPTDEVDYPSIHAYDSIRLVAELFKASSGTRASVKDAFTKVKDMSSVLHGKISFNPVTRYTDASQEIPLVVKNGQLVRWEK